MLLIFKPLQPVGTFLLRPVSLALATIPSRDWGRQEGIVMGAFSSLILPPTTCQGEGDHVSGGRGLLKMVNGEWKLVSGKW